MTEQQTGPAATSGLDKAFDTIRRLGVQRRTEDKWIGGVCSGVADRLGVDPVIVRAGLVLLALLGGLGVTLYLLAWVLLPDRTGAIAAERAIRGGDTGSVILLVIAAIVFFSGFPWWFDGPFHGGFPWVLIAVGGLVWWFWASRRTGRGGDGDGNSGGNSGGAPPADDWAGPAAAPAGAPPAPQAPQNLQWAPPQSPARAVAKRARRRSGGLLMTLVAVGLALVAYGATQWLGTTYDLAGNDQSLAISAALAALGLLLVGMGLSGWRAGFVGFLAIVAMVAALTSSVFPRDMTVGGRFGDQTWAPTSLSGGTGYAIAAGQGVLDLGSLPTEGLSDQVVPVSIGVGDLVVRVPEALTVDVRSHVGLGEIVLPGDGNRTDSASNLTRRAVIGTGPTEVVVNANVGLGQITVVKE